MMTANEMKAVADKLESLRPVIEAAAEAETLRSECTKMASIIARYVERCNCFAPGLCDICAEGNEFVHIF